MEEKNKITRRTFVRTVGSVLAGGVVAGFGTALYKKTLKGDKLAFVSLNNDEPFSAYKEVYSVDMPSEIVALFVGESGIYVAEKEKITVLDTELKPLNSIKIASNPRDFIVAGEKIIVLYPARIIEYSLQGEKENEWEACDKNADYCAVTATSTHFFVSDAGNKTLCMYRKNGEFEKMIQSPNQFIIPSYSFDLLTINDTVYCANSGRHLIEVYSNRGEYIGEWGKSGGELGTFAGCCNPAHIAVSPAGDLLTSEKGNPRISLYSKDGKFRSLLMNAAFLGGGRTAYHVQTAGCSLIVAGGNRLILYAPNDNATAADCNRCESDCPMRK